MKGDIVKIENSDELQKKLRSETDGGVKIRLIFLNALSNLGISYDEASEICGLSTSTGYVWIRKWNKGGYEALIDIETKTGRPPRLNEDNMIKLKEILKIKSYWTTKEVVTEIKTHFNVDLSDDQVIKILRNKFDMLFSKPYPMDFRRPANAEEILDNQLNLVFSLLKEKGITEDEIALGFIDEARPQNTANTVKVWSFEKVRSIKNTTKFNANTIGFYAIKGNSVSTFLNDSKAPSIAGFLDDIKVSNNTYKAIVGIIDNFSSHRSKLVMQKAKELDIYFVFLPTYSPDLNPIEFIWKSIKRVLSLSFVHDLEEMKSIIAKSYSGFAELKSYARYWIEKFILNNTNYKNLCD
jgi:transposase